MIPMDLLDEIADATPLGSWILVGGLMVHVHSLMAGVANPRPTLDADIVVELSAISYLQAANSLKHLGFAAHDPIDPGAPFHRFLRGSQQVDLMAPDGRRVTFMGRTVIAVPGARSALKHPIAFVTSGGRTIHVPNLESALSLKGAACGTPSPNPERHLQDAVLLFACAGRRKLDVSTSMRANFNRLLVGLGRADAWRTADPQTTLRAVRAIRSFRSDWSPPPGVTNHTQ